MGRPLTLVAAGLTLFAGVNLVLSAGRTLSAGDDGADRAGPTSVVAMPSSTPTTTRVTTVRPLGPPPSAPPTTVAAPATATTTAPATVEAVPDTDPAGPGQPLEVLDSVTATLPDLGAPSSFLAATVPTQGIGCGAEPFASAFARTGFTPTEVNVGSCEVVLDIPGRTPSDQVCAQVSGPPVARSIHIAQRTMDGDCRRDALGVVIHEIGHAWHLADPTRFYRVLTTFGLDPRADASLEVVAECFVEAVGYLDTDCGGQGVAYLRGEMDASRRVG